MSNDNNELEGTDEMSFGEHFAPVWNSLRRTATSRWVWMYTVSFVGVIVLSASIGGVIIGAYAAVQPTYGLCNDPVIDVYSSENTETLTAGADAPNFTRFDYGELSTEERQAFREALASATNDAELDGTSEHIETFQEGAVVSYRGEDHYTVVETMDNCVPMNLYNLPLGIVGSVVGGALFVSPSLWRRFSGSE